MPKVLPCVAGAANLLRYKCEGLALMLGKPRPMMVNKYLHSNLSYGPLTAFSHVALVADAYAARSRVFRPRGSDPFDPGFLGLENAADGVQTRPRLCVQSGSLPGAAPSPGHPGLGCRGARISSSGTCCTQCINWREGFAYSRAHRSHPGPVISRCWAKWCIPNNAKNWKKNEGIADSHPRLDIVAAHCSHPSARHQCGHLGRVDGAGPRDRIPGSSLAAFGLVTRASKNSRLGVAAMQLRLAAMRSAPIIERVRPPRA